MTKKDLYHYTMCGLDYIYLSNGYTIEQDPTYGEVVSIENADALHTAIGLNIVKNLPKLTGQEIRFLRAEMDMSQQNIADFFEVTTGTINSWERDKTELKAATDVIFRMLYLQFVNEHPMVKELLEKLNELQAVKIKLKKMQRYAFCGHKWNYAKAA